MIRISAQLTAIGLACFLAAWAQANDVRFTVTDLGVLSGAPSNGGTFPTAMNALGQVVGHADTTVSSSSGTALAEHAFLYSGSGPLVDLGTLGGPDSYAIATEINNSGTIVGYSESAASGNPTRAFVWTASGGLQDLPIYPGGTTSATDINNLGQIVGYATDASGAYHSFVYSAGAPLVELNPKLPPLLINDASDIVAITSTASNSLGTYISTAGTGAWTNIGSLGGLWTQPEGMNNLGDVVGWSRNASGTVQGAFLYSGGTMTDLGSFGGSASEAIGVNDYGVVVGGSELPGNSVGHAFIYYGSGPIEDLNDLVDPTLGWTLGNAMAINDAGQIAVAGFQQNAPEHALLLTPVPEPCSLHVLCGVGFAFILAKAGARLQRRRRIYIANHFQNHLQVPGGSDHIQASVDERCSRTNLGDRRHVARKTERAVPASRRERLSPRGDQVPRASVRVRGSATVVNGGADVEPALNG